MAETEHHLKQHIAEHLKAIRAERKLSLDAVAKLTGVSKAMLGQIERQESSPTIAKLWQIASGLDTSFSAFLDPAARNQAQSETIFPDDPDMQITPLIEYDLQVGYEMLDVWLFHHHVQHSNAHAHGVIETVWVLEGELEVFCDHGWHLVKTNEVFRFHADQRHSYRAHTERTRFQNIVNYP